MKKKHKLLILICLLTVFLSLTLIGCGNTENQGSDKVKIVEFEVNEFTTTIDIGTEYDFGKVFAKDDKGNYHVAEISVIDPDGEVAEIITTSSGKKTLICSKFGFYTVTYTVTYNETEKISKTAKLDVVDISEPSLKTSLYEHNIGSIGQKISLDDFVVSDNSKEEITHEVDVYFNGVLDNNSVSEGVLTLEKEGCYTIEVTASDSSDNKMMKEFNIYTLMDFEANKCFNNPTYATQITSDESYDGTHSYEFGAFDNHYSYFNDYSMLGCLQILDEDMKYVSFWIKFQNPNYSNILKARYHETFIYDQFGDELPRYLVKYEDGREDYEGYELFGDRWYKIVIDLTKVVQEGETEDIAEVVAKPQSLDLIPFYWGAWDSMNGCNAQRSQYIYLDNIMLTNDPESGFKPLQKSDYEFPKNCIADFESKDQLEALTPSWNTKISLTDEIITGNNALKFVPYAVWSSFGIKGLLGVDELTSYKSMTAKVYIKDESETNAYGDSTYVVVALRYRLEDSSYEEIISVPIKTTENWVNIELPLGTYNQYPLSSRDFDLCIFKVVNEEVVATGQYNDKVTIYLDDFYVK